MDLPRPLSNSSISLYEECPQKYKFKYIDNIQEKPKHFFSFGSTIHSAVEFFYGAKTPVAPSLKDLLAYYREHWISAGYKDKAQEEKYFEDGRDILERFWDKHAKDYHLPAYIEYRFDMEMDGVPVTGRIDRIDTLPDGTLSVLDYKTGKPLSADRVETDSQLTLYQIACEKLLGAKVARLVFYHLPSLTEQEAKPRPEKLVSAMTRKVVATAEAISQGLFEPKPEERKCFWCDYKPICPVFKHQYPSGIEAAAPAPAEPDSELSALIDRCGELEGNLETLQEELALAKKELMHLMARRGYARAFGRKFEVRRVKTAQWEYSDKKKVLELLTEAGLYEKVLAPSAPKVEKLFEDASLDSSLKAKLETLAQKVETQDLKINPL